MTETQPAEALFDLADVGLELTPTEAMRRGEQHVHQCSWCGAVVVWHQGGFRAELGDCPSCGRHAWWTSRLPVAGLSTTPTEQDPS